MRVSHRQYVGGGNSTVVLRCASCGRTATGSTSSDADRRAANTGYSGRHQPIDEGPPPNPVLDPEVARRLLEELGG